MKITEIYEKYHLPENLQMHMLRIAACGKLITDHWVGPEIDRESIVRVCLLHDMGNMVKIPEDFSKDEEFRRIRKKYFDKYGTNDHAINLEIGKQEGLTEKELMILDGKRSRKNEETLHSDSYERKICAYCDQRVAPDGVVGIKERLEDAKVRYKDKPLSVWSNEEKADYLIQCSLGIERQIMEYCKLKPEEINDDSIKPYTEQLKTYEIKNVIPGEVGITEEFFDILDESGNKTGKTKSRSEVHRDGDWHKSVHVWILNDNKDVLLQRRCATKDSHPYMLDISAAGHLSAGEESIEGAVREVNEELGLEVKPEELKFIKTLKRGSKYTSAFINNEFADLYIMITDKKISDMKFQEEEISEIFFVSYKKFKEMVVDKQSDLLMHTEEFEILFNLFDKKFDG